ncbi:helix-turn-helix domain-containing protein [Saccharopolyspora pogona]|uniref:helix-turn-helix domain-containing protein n=1 Tax=Saccharopolyspora pogona TaxID=333966 RepID=UPI0016868110|nr:LysR family transcriptional regulator [Saccharopolyspora pogona]
MRRPAGSTRRRPPRVRAAASRSASIGCAAQRLFVSQPALSKQIRVLERGLGFDLFERRARDVVLTPQGEVLLLEATASRGAVPGGTRHRVAHRGHAPRIQAFLAALEDTPAENP